MNRKEFSNKVYDIVRDIPPGNVATYGMIAVLSGYPQCSRMVGQALHHAPDSHDIPCHRVVNHQGRLVPGWTDQKRLLANEGVHFKENGCVNLKKYLWDFVSKT
ncbi:methylated-DNA--[protein]-cysteine S-methyltransferase [Desulfosporosinus sp. FKB]|uniref:MGMT family protein n=1 Tax=Desulfosporosinus sp. FKB TaxID=1969835 RepID=UPI000B49B7D2|nr:methylated-DNA--[protein]-cysteine S-methyltransferase [Desulfosporosinus sp. FKB]